MFYFHSGMVFTVGCSFGAGRDLHFLNAIFNAADSNMRGCRNLILFFNKKSFFNK
jgi:hypothetical protein